MAYLWHKSSPGNTNCSRKVRKWLLTSWRGPQGWVSPSSAVLRRAVHLHICQFPLPPHCAFKGAPSTLLRFKHQVQWISVVQATNLWYLFMAALTKLAHPLWSGLTSLPLRAHTHLHPRLHAYWLPITDCAPVAETIHGNSLSLSEMPVHTHFCFSF